jgi:hypothetical protein
MVLASTTLGMLTVALPEEFVGNKFSAKGPMKLMHSIAAGTFAVIGLLTLLQLITGVSMRIGWSVRLQMVAGQLVPMSLVGNCLRIAS